MNIGRAVRLVVIEARRASEGGCAIPPSLARLEVARSQPGLPRLKRVY